MSHETMKLQDLFLQYAERAKSARLLVSNFSDSDVMFALREITDTRGPHKIREDIRELFVEIHDAWADYYRGTDVEFFTPGERKKIHDFLGEEMAVHKLERFEERKGTEK